MPCHWCEVTACVLGFAGSALLSVDAIFGKKRTEREAGREEVQKETESVGATYVDGQGRPIEGPGAVQFWFASRSQRWNRMGFLLMAAGFLLDLFGKLGG